MATIASTPDRIETDREPDADRRDRLSTFDKRVKLFNRFCTGILIAFALIWLVPIAWTIDTAIKPNAETTKTTWWTSHPTLDSFTTLLKQGDIVNWYAASFITALLTAVGCVLTASMAAFALSRLRFRYRRRPSGSF